MNEGRRLPPGHRSLRLGGAPTASVVVASRGTITRLDQVLAWLLPTCEAKGIEVVVARNFGPDEYQQLGTRHPDVLLMPAPDGAGSRQLRFVGISAAEGDIVMMLDDDAPLDDEWLTDLPSAPEADPAGA